MASRRNSMSKGKRYVGSQYNDANGSDTAEEESIREPYIHSVKAFVYDKILHPLPPGESNGKLIIEWDDTGRKSEAKTTEFELAAVWVSEVNPQKTDVCKVHAIVPSKDESEKDGSDGWYFANEARKCGGVNVYSGNQGKLVSVDEYMQVLRFGTKYGDTYQATGNDYTTTPIYDNKAAALNDMFKAIQRTSSAVQFAGIDLINLDAVPDNILEELGFIKVPDKLGFSAPMWAGDPETFITMGQYSRYNVSYGERRDKFAEVVNSFLDILEKALA